MNYNIPVICYDVRTNRETTEFKSYYFKDAKDLKLLIGNLLDNNLVDLKNYVK